MWLKPRAHTAVCSRNTADIHWVSHTYARLHIKQLIPLFNEEGIHANVFFATQCLCCTHVWTHRQTHTNADTHIHTNPQLVPILQNLNWSKSVSFFIPSFLLTNMETQRFFFSFLWKKNMPPEIGHFKCSAIWAIKTINLIILCQFLLVSHMTFSTGPQGSDLVLTLKRNYASWVAFPLFC